MGVTVSTEHRYSVALQWTGNRGTGTSDYRAYGRDHDVTTAGCPTIAGSADRAFRGDPARWNPEQLLLAALSQCHMLWYLHLCADAGVVVTAYRDDVVGTMTETTGGGRFTEVVLQPMVEVAGAEMLERAVALHADAHRACFIANSVNFPVGHRPVVRVSD